MSDIHELEQLLLRGVNISMYPDGDGLVVEIRLHAIDSDCSVETSIRVTGRNGLDDAIYRAYHTIVNGIDGATESEVEIQAEHIFTPKR